MLHVMHMQNAYLLDACFTTVLYYTTISCSIRCHDSDKKYNCICTCVNEICMHTVGLHARLVRCTAACERGKSSRHLFLCDTETLYNLYIAIQCTFFASSRNSIGSAAASRPSLESGQGRSACYWQEEGMVDLVFFYQHSYQSTPLLRFV